MTELVDFDEQVVGRISVHLFPAKTKKVTDGQSIKNISRENATKCYKTIFSFLQKQLQLPREKMIFVTF